MFEDAMNFDFAQQAKRIFFKNKKRLEP